MKIFSDLQQFPINDYTACDALNISEASVCIDVGAASGSFTKNIKRCRSDARVIAVEAFPGNHEKLERWVGCVNGVRIVRAAAADYTGRAAFYCHATRADGRSNIGYLVRSGMKRHLDKTQEVDVVRLDQLTNEHILLLKIDVQGGELSVLRGAEGLFRGRGVDILYVEFSGDVEVLHFLLNEGYVLYDTNYRHTQQSWANEWLLNPKTVALTTGASAFIGRLSKNPPRQPESYAEWISTAKTGTDIIAVRPELANALVAAISKANIVSVMLGAIIITLVNAHI